MKTVWLVCGGVWLVVSCAVGCYALVRDVRGAWNWYGGK